MSLNHYKSILKVEHLDSLMGSVLSANNPVTWVVAAIKMFIYSAYIKNRINMINLDMIIKKQETEIENQQNDQDSVDIIN